jgi:16S rRNA (adenine1518-N6/adenine1519-N6)-dimethyltransferase
MTTGNQVAPKKSLGQHWLVDTPSLDTIVEAAELNSQDVVLEIGPGTGNLTKLLAPKVKQVIAVEIDISLLKRLNDLKISNLELISQDILTLDFSKLPEGYKIVANIPYYLTSKLIRLISETSNRPSKAVLLVQKEIAERMSASPGRLSILGLTSQYFWTVQKGELVEAYKFHPAPKVDSQFIILDKKTKLSLDPDNQIKLFKLIRIGFAAKRKTLLNNLSNGFELAKPEVIDRLKSIGIEPQIRPQNLGLDDWIKLNKLF